MSEYSFDFNMILRRDIPLRRFEAGERIFLEHDAGDAMYVVRSGAVEVIDGSSVVEQIGAGGVFGETAIIDDAPRAASARARCKTEVAVIDKPAFLALVADEPDFALYVMKLMAGRARQRAGIA